MSADIETEVAIETGMARELDRMLDAAAACFDPTGASAQRDARRRWLAAIADALDARAEELVPLAQDETHLPEARLRGELRRTTFQLRFLGDVIADGSYLDPILDPRDPSWPMGPRPDLRLTRVPLGPVAVFAASNFPFAFSVAGGDTASALAAGCPVVVKTHPGHPRLSRAVATITFDALAAAGAPGGLFAAIEGVEAGRMLVSHPRIAAVAFTGSESGGRALFDVAMSRPDPIPFFGEFGAVNPVVVTPTAAGTRAPEIAEGWIGSLALGSGQFCTNPGLLLCPADSRIPELAARAAAGTGADEMLTPRIRKGFDEGLGLLVDLPGSELLAGGVTTDPAPLVTVVAVDAREFQAAPDRFSAEVFGPAGLIVRYRGTAELATVLGALRGQLTGTIQGVDADPDAAPILDALVRRAGRVLWNEWPTGVTVSWAQQHGGPWPATTAPSTTSVGARAIDRFLRPVAFQELPDALLPPELRGRG